MAHVPATVRSSRPVHPRAGTRVRRVDPASRAHSASVRPARLSRSRPLVSLAGLLAFAAVILLLTMPDPKSPAPLAVPAASAPRAGGPNISIPTPSLDAPNIKSPGLSLQTLSLPDIGSGSDGQPHSSRPPAGPEHRTELIHDHHRVWRWWLDLPLLLLFLVALVALRPFARLPRQGQRLFGATVAAGLPALAVAAFAAGISQESSAGRYQREAPEIERSHGFLDLRPETIVKRVRIDHFHPPVHLAGHWLLLGLGLAALAVPGARVAATRRDARASHEVGQVTT